MAPPAFRYRIDALRVDGTQSADPRDYRDYAASTPVGAELHAYVTAELDRGIAPDGMRGRGGVVRWKLPEALLLALAPTVADLRYWGRAGAVVSDCGGAFTPVQKRKGPGRAPSS
jgi:hypothetical protein